jgi:NIMA-interacting peptidyl-prolyl cis-trans isomerase 1
MRLHPSSFSSSRALSLGSGLVAVALTSLLACGAETYPRPAASEGAGATAAPASGAPASSTSSATSAPPAPATSPETSAASSTPPVAAAAPATDPHPKKITARHILIQWMGCTSAAPSVVRTRDQARVVAQDVLRRVKAGEDFPRLVVDFSDEPNAGARGGSLGRFGHGAMVKEFEEAAFALKPGEVSDVVESPFGFYIIQRME